MIRLLLPLVLLAFPVSAAEMTVFMKNEQSRAVAVELYGENQRWPGGEQVYLLDKGERKSVVIGCREGERICWGAWLNGDDRQSFGVGFDRSRACPECCRICVGSTIETVVIE
jgi:hypothetical protein